MGNIYHSFKLKQNSTQHKAFAEFLGSMEEMFVSQLLNKKYDGFRSLVLQYIPRNMHTVFALLCFVVVIHWLIFPYPSGLLYWHCGNLTIAPVPAKQPWWIWINTSCEFIMNDCITTTKQSTTKPCAYFLGYTVVKNDNCIHKVITSSHGNAFRITGFLWGEANGHRWIPTTKGQWRGLLIFPLINVLLGCWTRSLHSRCGLFCH